MTGIEIKGLLAAIMIALGVAVPMPDFLGGMFVGLGCSYGVMIFTPPEGKRGVVATLFAGFVLALLAAIFHPTPLAQRLWLWREIPLQLQMGLAGALSASVFGAFPQFGSGLGEWARALPTRFRFPGGKP